MSPQATLRRLERDLLIAFGAMLALVVAASLVAFFSIRSLNRTTDQIRSNAHVVCRATNKARADGNVHVRRPLKAIADELALILHQAASHNPKQKAATEALAKKFSSYAATVRYLSLLNCRHP